MSSHHPHTSALLTRDGDPIVDGMAVRDGWRGTGVVLRQLADGVVIRWDRDVREPARTTIVGPNEISRRDRRHSL